MTDTLTIPEVLAALNISRSTFYRWVAAGKFHPKRLTLRGVVVPRSEVDAILNEEI